MSTSLLLRIAAILILVHFAGHTGGHLGWDEPADPQLKEVVLSMKEHTAEFMGASRSMADYFEGYSLIMFVVFAMNIVLLFILANAGKNKTTKALLWPLGLGWIAIAVIEYAQFFPFAALISGLAGLLILAAVFTMPSMDYNETTKP